MLIARNTFVGQSVAASGDWMVLGTRDNMAYVYKRAPDGTWGYADSLSSGGDGGTTFGWNVAMSDDWMAVTSSQATVDSYSNAGKVYLYQLSADGTYWAYQRSVTMPTLEASVWFGASLSLSGGHLLVSTNNTARIFYAHVSGSVAIELADVSAYDGETFTGSRVAVSASVDGAWAAVLCSNHVFLYDLSVPGFETAPTYSDKHEWGTTALYLGLDMLSVSGKMIVGSSTQSGFDVYVYSGGTWVKSGHTTNASCMMTALYGSTAVCAHNGYVSVYVIFESGYTSALRSLTPTTSGDPHSIALSESGLFLGAGYVDTDAVSDNGGVYVYHADLPYVGPTTLKMTLDATPTLLQPSAAANSSVGVSSADGQWLVMGGYGVNSLNGAVYMYRNTYDTSTESWVPSLYQTLSPPSGAVPSGTTDLRFGASVSVSGDRLAIGTSFEKVDLLLSVGAVYTYTFDGEWWVEDARIVPASPVAETRCGVFVAIQDDRVFFRCSNGDIHMATCVDGTWGTPSVILTGWQYAQFALSGDTFALFGINDLHIYDMSVANWESNAPAFSENHGFCTALGSTSWGIGAVDMDSGAGRVVYGVGAGTVRVSYYDGSTWVQENTFSLTAQQVALRGSTIALGSANSLAVYSHSQVLGWVSVNWVDPGTNGSPCASLSVSEYGLYIGATGLTSPSAAAGGVQAYSYLLPSYSDSSSLLTELSGVPAVIAPSLVAGAAVGSEISVDGEWLAIGAPTDFERGLVYMYRRQDDLSYEYFETLSSASWSDANTGWQGGGYFSFGYSVSVSGDRVAIGAHLSAPYGTAYAGAVYTFTYDATNGWETEGLLTEPELTSGLRFGSHVTLSGSTLVVQCGESGTEASTVYTITNGGVGVWGSWNQLTQPAGYNAALSAYSKDSRVSMSGDWVAVTGETVLALYDKSQPSWYNTEPQTLYHGLGEWPASVSMDAYSGSGRVVLGSTSGSVTVYTLNSGTWELEGTISTGAAEHVSLYGTTLAVATSTSVDTYAHDGTDWSLLLTLHPSAAPSDVVVSEYGLQVGAATFGDAGAVYVYPCTQIPASLPNTVANQLTVGPDLRQPSATAGDAVGVSIAAEGDWMAAGSNASGGAVHMYQMQANGVYNHKQIITGTTGSMFGTKLAMSGTTLAVAAPLETVDGDANAGVVYVYLLNESGVWGHQATLVGTMAMGTTEKFGTRIALSGDTIVVSSQDDMVYYFTRTGTWWSEAVEIVEPEAGVSFNQTPALAMSDHWLAILGYNSLFFYDVSHPDWHASPYQSFSGFSDWSDSSLWVSLDMYSGYGRAIVGSKVQCCPEVYALSEDGVWAKEEWLENMPVWGDATECAIYGETLAIASSHGVDVYAYDASATKVWDIVSSPRPNLNAVTGGLALTQHGMVVGAPGIHNTGIAAGGVYVYTLDYPYSGPALSQSVPELFGSQPYLLKPSFGNARFGMSVSSDGDWVVTGSPYEGTGMAYVGKHASDGSWLYSEEFTAPDTSVASSNGYLVFGWSVAISGTRMVVSATYEQVDGVDTVGAVYTYTLDHATDTWSLEQTIYGPTGCNQFGLQLALSGSDMLISSSHAVYRCRHNGVEWGTPMALAESYDGAFSSQPINVTLDGGWAAVQTLAYIFMYDTTLIDWHLLPVQLINQWYLSGPHLSLDMSSGRGRVSAGVDVATGTDVYVFQLSETGIWTYETLFPVRPCKGVALYGDMLAVGTDSTVYLYETGDDGTWQDVGTGGAHTLSPLMTNGMGSLHLSQHGLFVGCDRVDAQYDGLVYAYPIDLPAKYSHASMPSPYPDTFKSWDNPHPFNIAVDGEWAVMGAPYEYAERGRAFVARRQADNSWAEFQTLVPRTADVSSPRGIDTLMYGHWVAVCGDYIAVGLVNAKVDSVNFVGSVHIYKAGATEFELDSVSLPPATHRGGDPIVYFGIHLAMSHSTLVIGGVGAVYVQSLDDTGTWGAVSVLKEPVTDCYVSGDVKLDADGDWVAVLTATHIYMYVTTKADWSTSDPYQAIEHDIVVTCWFCGTISLDMSSGPLGRVAIGVSDGATTESLAVYALVRDEWQLENKFDGVATTNGSVSLYGDTLAIGTDSGISLFTYDTNNWVPSVTVHPEVVYGGTYVSTIALSEGGILVGQVHGEGALYWYPVNLPGTERPAALESFLDDLVVDPTLLSPTSSSEPQTGRSVDMDGDWLVVGAPREDSTDNSGRVYIYKWDTTTGDYAYHSQLDPPGSAIPSYTNDDSRAQVMFGISVSISQTSLAVGASDTKVTNDNVGMVYVYDLVADVWTLAHELVPPSTNTYFGSNVSLEGSNLVVAGHNTLYTFQLVTNVWSSYISVAAPFASCFDSSGRSSTRVSLSDNWAAVVTMTHLMLFDMTDSDWHTNAPAFSVDLGGVSNVLDVSIDMSAGRCVLAIGDPVERYLQVYAYNNDTWALEQTLPMVEGMRVAVYGSVIAVGCANEARVYAYSEYSGRWYLAYSMDLDSSPTAVSLSEYGMAIGASGYLFSTGAVFVYPADVPAASSTDTTPASMSCTVSAMQTREVAFMRLRLHASDGSMVRVIPEGYVPHYATFNESDYPVHCGPGGECTLSLVAPLTAGTYAMSLHGGKTATDVSPLDALGLSTNIVVSGIDYPHMTRMYAPADPFTRGSGDSGLVDTLLDAEPGLVVTVYDCNIATDSELHAFRWNGTAYAASTFSNFGCHPESLSVSNGVALVGCPTTDVVGIIDVAEDSFGDILGYVPLPGSSGINFGALVAHFGDWLAVASDDDVHVFHYDLYAGWRYTQSLSYGIDTVASLAMHSGYLALGQPTEAGDGLVRVYALDSTCGLFELMDTLSMSQGGFGSALSLDADWLAVHATEADDSGSVYLFQKDGEHFVHQHTRTHQLNGVSSLSAGDLFGAGVTLSGAQMIVGSPLMSCWGVGASENGGAMIYPNAHSATAKLYSHLWVGGSDTRVTEVALVGGYAVSVGSYSAREIQLWVPTPAPDSVTVTPVDTVVPLAPVAFTVSLEAGGAALSLEGVSVTVTPTATPGDQGVSVPCVYDSDTTSHACVVVTPPGEFTLSVLLDGTTIHSETIGADVDGVVQGGMQLAGFYGDGCVEGVCGTAAGHINTSGGTSLIMKGDSALSIYQFRSSTQVYTKYQDVSLSDITAHAAMSPECVVIAQAVGTVGTATVLCNSAWPYASSAWTPAGGMTLSQADMYMGSRGATAAGNRIALLNGDANHTMVLFRRDTSGLWVFEASIDYVRDAHLETHCLLFTHTDTAFLTSAVFNSARGPSITVNDVEVTNNCSISSVTQGTVLLSCLVGDDTHLVPVTREADGTLTVSTALTDIKAHGGSAMAAGAVYASNPALGKFGPDSGGLSMYETGAMHLELQSQGPFNPLPNAGGGYGAALHGSDDGWLHVMSQGVGAGRGVAVYGPRLIPQSMASPSVSARPGQHVAHSVGVLSSGDGRVIPGAYELYAVLEGVETEVARRDYDSGSYTLTFTAPCTAGTYTMPVYAKDCADVSMAMTLTVSGTPAPHPSQTTIQHSSTNVCDVSVSLGGICGVDIGGAESVTLHWDSESDTAASYDSSADAYGLTLTEPTSLGPHTLSVCMGYGCVEERWHNLPGVGWLMLEEVRRHTQ
ncbi:hypothetical protein KIPB_002348 [Kipferlia bialata]|uniref:Uncharacterized protein n=1 Tax=Kipferlia bialata TaxID=797122 RepID=A0A9K3CRM3_9EUKA|nr:hypothetical protein KIPB_002348 [Kipferlia bialata]|eukprot:g2348.t1